MELNFEGAQIHFCTPFRYKSSRGLEELKSTFLGGVDGTRGSFTKALLLSLQVLLTVTAIIPVQVTATREIFI